MSIPIQLHVMKLIFFCFFGFVCWCCLGFFFVWLGFLFVGLFFLRFELFHPSTLPMQIYCDLYLGTGRDKKVCGITYLHCSSPKSSVIDEAMALYPDRSRKASPISEIIIYSHREVVRFFFLWFGKKLTRFRNYFPSCTLHAWIKKPEASP